MISLILGALAVLALLAAVAAGIWIGYRHGFRAGRTETVLRLVASNDAECATAAHYIVADLAAEAKTQRIVRAKS